MTMTMTDTTIVARPDLVAPDDAAKPASRRRRLVLSGAGAAILAAGGVAFYLMTSSNTGSDAPFFPSVQGKASAAPSGSPSTAASAAAQDSQTAGRDPFAPLVTGQQTSASVKSGTSTSAGSVAKAPSTSTVVGTPTVLSVSAINVTTGTATVTVAGKAYDAKVGATFGQDYLLYSVFNSSCVGVLVGDQSLAVCSTKPVTFTR